MLLPGSPSCTRNRPQAMANFAQRALLNCPVSAFFVQLDWLPREAGPYLANLSRGLSRDA